MVNSGGTLEIAGGVNVLLEALTLNGTGFNNTMGRVLSSGGTNTWAGQVAVNGVLVDGHSLISSNNAKALSAAYMLVSGGSSLSLSGVVTVR